MPDEVINEAEQPAIPKTPKDIVIETFKALDSWEEEWEPIIDFQKDHFLIYFGDIKNTYVGGSRGTQGDGSEYYLLDTYVKIPYEFHSDKCRLYRGVVNEYELNEYGEFTGFVHFSDCMNDGHFCYGQSGVEGLLNNMAFEILDEEKLNPDNLDFLYVLFKNYLSQSSHDTYGSSYKKLDLPSNNESIEYNILRKVNFDGVLIPVVFEEITWKKGITSIDYTKPYVEVVKEFSDRKFEFKGKTITPIAVKHEYIIDEVERREIKHLKISKFSRNVKRQQIEKARAKLSNEPRFSLNNYFLKLPNKSKGVDGGVYL